MGTVKHGRKSQRNDNKKEKKTQGLTTNPFLHDFKNNNLLIIFYT